MRAKSGGVPKSVGVKHLIHSFFWHDPALLTLLVVCGTLAVTNAQTLIKPKPHQQGAVMVANYGNLPLSFESNQGQVDPQVRFVSRGDGYSLFLTDREAVLSLRKTPARGSARSRTDVITMQLLGADPAVRVNGGDKMPGTANYFIGNDASKWHSGVPTYSKVDYSNVYPGIDLIYYGNQHQLEYDYVVAPGADPSQIRIRFRGTEKLSLEKNGDLRVVAPDGEIAFHAPIAYQPIDGRRLPVDGRFVLLSKNTIGFDLRRYDSKHELVIDPTLGYSTFLGSNGARGNSIAVDNNGEAYVTGTVGTTFPTTAGAFQTTGDAQGTTAFVAKINASGTALIYSTYLGGSGAGDWPFQLRADSSGNAYVAGEVYSTDFPVTSGALQTTNKGGPNQVPNCFITKLNTTGTALVYSTYLGGSGLAADAGTINVGGDPTGGDGCFSLAIDSAGDAYVAGETWSKDFPTTAGTLQTINKSTVASANGFVAKLNPAGSALVYSTYLGGSKSDGVGGIAVDSTGDVYVDGAAGSSDFPVTANAFQSTNKASANGYSNAFAAKMNATGTTLIYSTLIGGSGNPGGASGNNNGDVAGNIAIDSSGNAYLFGLTFSNNFPVTAGAYQTTNPAFASGLAVNFVTKFNSAGSSPIYSTYVGSELSGATVKSGIAIDPAGDLYFTGVSFANNYPVTPNAFQASNKCEANHCGNAILSELNTTGSALVYSTYLGGSGYMYTSTSGGVTTTSYLGDYGEGLALDGSGNVYLTGQAYSPDFPVSAGAYQTTKTADSSAFVTKLDFSSGTSTISTGTTLTSSANPQTLGDEVTFTATVKPVSGSGTPTGSVTFTVDGGSATINTLSSSGEATYSTSSLTAGSHVIAGAYSGDSSYSASSGTITETINGLSVPSITAVSGSGQTTTYGSVFANPLVVIVKDANGNPVSGATVTFAGTGLGFSSATTTTASNGEASVKVTALRAGSLTVTASTTNAKTSAEYSLTAGPASLTITAANATATYNQAFPAFTYSAKGFVNGDTAAVLTGAPSETTTAKQGSATGTYPITINQGTLGAANYDFQFVNGTLTILGVGTAAKPSFSPPGGTYTSAQSVTLSDSTPGAVIYYTTNGTTPTTSAIRYTTAIPVDSTETIEAIAVVPEYADSPVATAIYTLNLPAPPAPIYLSFSVPHSAATYPLNINEDLEITGYYLDASGNSHGFVRSFDGRITVFDVPGSLQTRPVSINGDGEITGYYLIPGPYDQVAKGFIRNRNGKITTFGTVAATSQDFEAQPIAMTRNGEVVGNFPSVGLGSEAFLRSATGAVKSFSINEGASYSTFLTAVNEHGDVVGYGGSDFLNSAHGFFYNGNGPLPSFSSFDAIDYPGATGSFPTGINNKGEIAGCYDINDVYYDFVRDRAGTFTTVSAPGTVPSCLAKSLDPSVYSILPAAVSLNDRGTIIGEVINAAKTPIGFVRFPDGKTIPFIIPDSTLTVPAAINNHDVLTGFYTKEGVTRGFIALP
jgi:hypothetical protein